MSSVDTTWYQNRQDLDSFITLSYMYTAAISAVYPPRHVVDYVITNALQGMNQQEHHLGHTLRGLLDPTAKSAEYGCLAKFVMPRSEKL
jgi:hypothetical protein